MQLFGGNKKSRHSAAPRQEQETQQQRQPAREQPRAAEYNSRPRSDYQQEYQPREREYQPYEQEYQPYEQRQPREQQYQAREQEYRPRERDYQREREYNPRQQPREREYQRRQPEQQYNERRQPSSGGRRVSSEGYDTRRQESVGSAPRFASDEYVSREERRNSKRWVRVTAILAAILLIVGVGGYSWLKSWMKPVAVDPSGPVQQTAGPDNPSYPDDVDATAPEVGGSQRKPGVYTFLVSGLDREGLHTDTNIVGMFDTVKGELNLINIPRDTLLNIPFSIKKMNQPYPAAVNNAINGGKSMDEAKKEGNEAILDAVSDLLGYRVDCYAIVDIKAVEEIVDAIGGVYYDIPFDMDWDAPDQTPELHIHIKAGYQLLDGENFVHAMRFRLSNDGSHDYAGGDMERIAFQQKLLAALAQQTLKLGNIPNLGKIFNVYERRVDTNVTVGNLAYFAQEFLKMDMSKINFLTIPNKPDAVIYKVWYVTIKVDEWLDMINTYLNPFEVDVTRENVDIISFDGANWDKTQGYIAGGDYSFLNSQA